MQKLAIFTKIRQFLSSAEVIGAVELKHLINQTQIIEVVMLALSNEPNRYIKLEAGWILTNIAYGDEDDFADLFTNPNFVNIINSILQDADN